MGASDRTMTLYTAQTQPVLEAIQKDGFCFCQAGYVEEKYQEVSGIFLTVYRQFVQEAAKLVAPPPGAQLPYWAFEQPRDLYVSPEARVLKLAVPSNQVILFDVHEWNRVLQFRYLGASPEEEGAFEDELKRRGITVWDVMNTSFYPDLRQRILKSWSRVLCRHKALLSGERTGSVQAALWQLRREWIEELR